MPKAVDPMMATLVEQPPASPDWLYEVKWDGIRGICFVEDSQLRIQSRKGNRCEQQYPELSVLPHYLNATNAVLDGEIAVLDENGRPRFSLIQPRIAVGDPNSVAHLSRKTPVTLFLFDLLYLDGYDLRQCPLIERKRLLSEVIEPADHIRVSDHFVAKGREMLEAARFKPWRFGTELSPPGIANHEVGTMRMGTDPATSVLSSFCQSWDVKNLFVMDGSCFVSQGVQNPTLTMLAITARSCDYLLRACRDL